MSSSENRCANSKEFCVWSDTIRKIINVNQEKKRIEPWGIPALILAHTDDWPLRRILWNLSLKKLSIRFKRSPEIPIDSSLNNKPLCQTLSKDFEIFKETALVSRVGLHQMMKKYCG